MEEQEVKASPTLAEKEAEIAALKKQEAEEILAQIQKILASKNAAIVPIVQIVGNQISSSWSISIP